MKERVAVYPRAQAETENRRHNSNICFSFQVIYNHVGCYGDKFPTAIPLLEGTDPSLTGNPSTRVNAVLKCARVALKRGFMYFALQNGGKCLSSLTAHVTYSTYGLASDCKDGKGGKNANDVYEVVMFGKTLFSGNDTSK